MENDYKNQKVEINKNLLIGVISFYKKEMKEIWQKIKYQFVYFQLYLN